MFQFVFVVDLQLIDLIGTNEIDECLSIVRGIDEDRRAIR